MEYSVTLDKDKCRGCTTCMKQCPTEAIRVRRGKAVISPERCIDCGNCIRVCPHHAKKAVCDSFDDMSKFDYRIALPAPALYGQFHNLDDINILLNALTGIGFDTVFEVARAAEILSMLTGEETTRPDTAYPIISSACPSVVRLVRKRFPKLIRHIHNQIAPVELAAILSRRMAVEQTGLPPERIGVFFITPCPAKMTEAHYPQNLEKPVIDGVLPMQAVYTRLLPVMKRLMEPESISKAGMGGVGWAVSGGECAVVSGNRSLAADGMENVINILEALEDGKLPDVDFLELNACTLGCVGGCLNVENPFAARLRMQRLRLAAAPLKLPEDCSELSKRVTKLDYQPEWSLDTDLQKAMQKYARIEKLYERLPKLDCGSCGTPSCRALAEDVVKGIAAEDDCVFMMREKLPDGEEIYLPPPFRT